MFSSCFGELALLLVTVSLRFLFDHYELRHRLGYHLTSCAVAQILIYSDFSSVVGLCQDFQLQARTCQLAPFHIILLAKYV